MISVIQRLINNDWQVYFCHVNRQANYCADALANLACGLEEDYVIFDHPKLLLLADVSGVSTPRLISM